MAANTQFSIAVHALTVLALRMPEFVTSDEIAESINTNPVIVRRILGCLHHAGLVESRLGKHGGSKLSLEGNKITLFDIYQAVECDGLFAFHAKPENRSCTVSCSMRATMEDVFGKTEKAVKGALSSITLEEILKPIKNRCESRRKCN